MESRERPYDVETQDGYEYGNASRVLVPRPIEIGVRDVFRRYEKTI